MDDTSLMVANGRLTPVNSFDAGRRAERANGPLAQTLRRLIAEAERAVRFLDGPNGDVDTARYRARQLRDEIALAKDKMAER